MKQNGRIQSQIISMVTSLVEIKLMEKISSNKDERFCIVEDVNFVEKQRKDQFGFNESYIELKEKPKKIVEIAKNFVENVLYLFIKKLKKSEVHKRNKSRVNSNFSNCRIHNSVPIHER